MISSSRFQGYHGGGEKGKDEGKLKHYSFCHSYQDLATFLSFFFNKWSFYLVYLQKLYGSFSWINSPWFASRFWLFFRILKKKLFLDTFVNFLIALWRRKLGEVPQVCELTPNMLNQHLKRLGQKVAFLQASDCNPKWFLPYPKIWEITTSKSLFCHHI